MQKILCHAAVIAGAVFAPFVANAATVTSSVWTQFTTTVTQPELINLGGAIHVVTQITPSDPCIPTDPCRAVPVTAYLNLAGVSGVGQSTGQRYRATGSATVSGSINLPGGFVVSAGFQLTPPNPIIPPNPINVQVLMSTDAAGNVTAPASQPQGLVSWWQAEGDATDALGNNNGTLQGTVGFVPGRVGQAFSFAGAGYVEVAASPTLQPATVTAMAWVRHAGFPGFHNFVLSKGADLCEFTNYGLTTSAGNLHFEVSDGATYAPSPDAGPGVWDGNWHLVAGTYDGATVRLYVDGVEVAPGNPTPTPLAINTPLPTNQKFYIGAYRGECELRFNGDIDEVKVFNRALTPSEILSIYQTTP